MKVRLAGSFGAQLKGLREAAGFTQEELATIAGLSVHAVSSLERGQRRRPQVDTVRALAGALELDNDARDALFESSRTTASDTVVEELTGGLPLAPTDLIGRDEALQTLQHWLTQPSFRLITLTGPGGAGKSRLALEVAHTVVADGATRVVYVPLAAIQEPSFVALGIAEAIGLSDLTAQELPARARMACGDRATLLLLDNFEHVLKAAPLVAELLKSIPSLKLLVTSRAPLRVRGEREFAVGPLDLDTDERSGAPQPADLNSSPAVQLFIERVRDVQPDFRLTPENGATVRAICQKLDALPLALELAAPWMKTLTADDLLRRLDRNVLLSPVGARDLPERQQTMSATIAWSYRLLGPNEQRTFRRLGVLRGHFRIEAAVAVLADPHGSPLASGDMLAPVADLIDKSLLLRAETSFAKRPRYQMLETVRAYAATELVASGECDAALEGLAAYCAREAQWSESGTGRAVAGRVARSHPRRSGELPHDAGLADRTRAGCRRGRRRMESAVLLADSRPRHRSASVVPARAESPACPAQDRSESARRRVGHVVHAGTGRPGPGVVDAGLGPRARHRRRRARDGGDPVRPRRAVRRSSGGRAPAIHRQPRSVPDAIDCVGHRQCAHGDGQRGPRLSRHRHRRAPAR